MSITRVLHDMEEGRSGAARPTRNLWRWATYALGLTTVVLAVAFIRSLLSSTPSAVQLYNT